MRTTRSPLLISAALVISGVALLLLNFLLIDLPANVSLGRYWPVLLVLIGLILLWRGDLAFTWQGQSFGITRGNVQSATLEAHSGELDVKVRALRRPGRLIAGQYTARSRPDLIVRGGQAALTMQRGKSWLLSLADWEIGLARDLPWQILVNTWLGDIEADLRGMRVTRAVLATGFGRIDVIAPDGSDSARDVAIGVINPDSRGLAIQIHAASTLGNVLFVAPPNVPVAVHILAGGLGKAQIDEGRYLLRSAGIYATLDYDAQVTAGIPPVEAYLRTTFGTVRLR